MLFISFLVLLLLWSCPESQVGIRKSAFSETEKVVTETVILKREQTAQEVIETQLTTIGSNGHLNMGK